MFSEVLNRNQVFWLHGISLAYCFLKNKILWNVRTKHFTKWIVCWYFLRCWTKINCSEYVVFCWLFFRKIFFLQCTWKNWKYLLTRFVCCCFCLMVTFRSVSYFFCYCYRIFSNKICTIIYIHRILTYKNRPKI